VNLSQSSVSERISALEKAVGVQLFDRIGRRIEPTEIGMLLYRQALKHLTLKEETRQALAEQLGASRGEILLGGSTIPGEYILPGVIKRFHDTHPLIVLRMRITDSRMIVAAVADGDLALGIVGAQLRTANLEFEKLWRDELVLVVPAGHAWARREAVSAADLVLEPFILRESGSGTRQVMERKLAEALRAKNVALNVAAELGSSTAVKSAVVAGLGVTMISSCAVAAELKAGSLVVVPIDKLSLPRHFYLVHDHRRTLSPVARAFREFLLADAAAQ
jgi:DNA-binding transcriptional LysR family regulator